LVGESAAGFKKARSLYKMEGILRFKYLIQ